MEKNRLVEQARGALVSETFPIKRIVRVRRREWDLLIMQALCVTDATFRQRLRVG